MNSKKNFINFNSEKIVNKINDLVIGEDSNDYLTVNSETRFHSDVNIGGSSIRLHSSDNTNSNNFISILDQNIHSIHAQTLRKIQDLQIGDNNGKYLKFDDSSGLVASTVSGGGGGGSGIVNNRIDGDLTIGEDDSEMLTIASKLHIPGGESGQVLTKGTDGIIEYGPTSFPSVTLPNDKQIQHKTLTGENTITVSGNSSSIFNDGTDNLEVTITPSLSSAKILVSVNTHIYSKNKPFLTLQKKVGTSTATIVGESQEINTNTYECNFKFIDTLIDLTAVTYTTLINNPSSNQNLSVSINNSSLPTLSSLFDDSEFKFMWQAGKNTTVKNNYTVTAVGGTINVLNDIDGHKYVSPTNNQYYQITDSNALMGRHQKNLSYAFVIDFNLISSSELRYLFYQSDNSGGSGDRRNHELLLISNTGHFAYDNFAPSGNSWGQNVSFNNMRSGKRVIVITMTQSEINIYENGILNGTSSKGNENYSHSGIDRIIIGGARYSTRNFGNDKLYSMAIWNRTLSRSEASSLTVDMLTNKTIERSSIITAKQISSARSFTTANPLLANPSTADKGKIVTVNSTGTDLEYGAIFKELAYKQTFLTGHQAIIESDHEKWFDLSSHQSDSDWQTLNTDTTVNVGNGSKVMINISLYIGSDGYGDHHYFFRLGKKINNTVVWGSSNGISTNNNDNQTDPKGVSSDNTTEAFMYSLDYDQKEQYGINEVTGHFVDENPTNGQSGTHNVTYFIRFRLEYPEGTGGTIGYIGRTFDSANNTDRQRMPTIVTVQELGLGAITSFTQEQALAGAGGTAAFTASGTPTSNATTLASLAASLAGAGGDESFTTYTSSLYDSSNDSTSEAHDDNITANVGGILYLTGNTNIYIAYEFTTPHVVNKYRIWGRGDFTGYNPKNFQLRASESKTEYDNGNFTTLSTITNASFPTSFPSSTASSNLNKSNEYTLTNTNEYKYYVLYITENNGTNNSRTNIAEFALYKTSNITALHDNSTLASGSYYSVEFGSSTEVAYEFNTPQIITKYRIWPRVNTPAADRKQNPKAWELRAATDSTTYNNGSGTYTILDSQSLDGADTEAGAKTGWKIDSLVTEHSTGNTSASTATNLANEYALSTIGAYKYYVLHITDNYGGTHLALSEWALYGGGFTIPSQVGHSGKILKTNGTSLKWEAPVDALLPAATTADKGKIVTVNSTGTDLEYGSQVLKHNMNFKNIYDTGNFQITASTVNNNPAVHPVMNITITPQLTTSKVMITVNMFGELGTDDVHDIMAYLRRTVNGVVTDLLPPVVGNSNRGLGQFVLSYRTANYDSTPEVCNFHYIDEPNTISEVRYDVLLVCDSTTTFHYNKTVDSNNSNNAGEEKGGSFMSAEEKFANDNNSVGAITSFTQEQALAGAGGTAAFTSYGLFNGSGTNRADTVVTTTGHVGGYYSTGTMNDKLHNNILAGGDEVALRHNGVFPVAFAYEFTTPQIITKYRLWGGNVTANKLPKTWELRGADKATYVSNDSTTYTILDSQVNVTTYTSSSSSEAASDNLSKAKEYNLSTIGAYKYYVLHIANNNGENYSVSISEWALYGGGFTIPSQIGNAGKQLITNGTSLTWGSPSSILVPSLTGNANKVLQANSAGTALEYGEGGSIIKTSHRLERGEHSKTLNKTNYNPDTNDYQINSNFKVGFTPTNSNSILRFSCDFNIGTSQANMWLLFHLYRRINGGTWVRINVNNTTSPGRRSTFLAAPRIEVAFSGPGSLGSITHQTLRNMQGEYFDNNWNSSWTSGQSVEYTIYWQYLYGPTGNGTMYLNRTHSNEDWGSTSSTLTLQELNHSNTTLSS